MSTFPYWPYFCVTLASWRRDAPGGVDEDLICSCGVVWCMLDGELNRWQWIVFPLMRLRSLSTSFTWCYLVQPTSASANISQPVVYGPILEQVQCKMLLGAGGGGGGGGGVGLQSVVWLTRAWQTMSALPGSQHPPAAGSRTVYLDTGTVYLFYIIPIGWCKAPH